MRPGLEADIIVFIHLLYVLFTVGGELVIITGGLAGWKWIRNRIFRIIHLAASFLVAFEALGGIVCPLTSIEYALRVKAGQTVNGNISFIGRLIRHIIFYDFPPIFFTLLYVGFASLVLATWIIFRPESGKSRK